LPNKYGICRGHIVTIDDLSAGDDIIIFDQVKYPTLRLLNDNSFQKKQYVPIEAVYAYVEAKHTIILEGSGPNSLEKAWKQSIAPKNLKRQEVKLGFSNKLEFNEKASTIKFNFQRLVGWPQFYNPMYTAIISQGLRIKQNQEIKKISNNNDLLEIFEKVKEYTTIYGNSPDLLIIDNDCGFTPTISLPNQKLPVYESPFHINGMSMLAPYRKEGIGFGIGIANLLFALENITLGSIEWKDVICKELGIKRLPK
jgi:hypothetical protein